MVWPSVSSDLHYGFIFHENSRIILIYQKKKKSIQTKIKRKHKNLFFHDLSEISVFTNMLLVVILVFRQCNRKPYLESLIHYRGYSTYLSTFVFHAKYFLLSKYSQTFSLWSHFFTVYFKIYKIIDYLHNNIQFEKN